MPFDPQPFPYDGTIDADGHVLEPADLWTQYMEARYRSRALRIDVGADGFEYLQIDGRTAERTPVPRIPGIPVTQRSVAEDRF